MDRDRFQQIEKLYHTALELEAGSREEYLDEACGDDEELRRRISDLLALDSESSGPINSPTDDLAAETFSTVAEPDLTGQSVGNFRITGKLGDGGMGMVYSAVDETLGRKLAIKFLNSQASKKIDSARRFELEAKTASALNHPNIITVYEIGRHEGRRYIATEFIDGVTLRELIFRNELDVRQILDISVQIVSALSAAHKAGIIHRDVKPGNVMVREDGIVKVLDFGVAKLSPENLSPVLGEASGEDTRRGMIIGTTLYMSPEQARGETVDTRTDIFSFGVVLYLMLSGRQPFEGGTPSDIIASVLTKEPDPIVSEKPVPGGLLAILRECLEKDRRDRYGSAEELLRELKKLRDSVRTGHHLTYSEAPTISIHRDALAGEPSISERPGGRSTDELSDSIIVPKRTFAKAALIFAVLAILLVPAAYFFAPALFSNFRDVSSVAVMPIRNETGDPELEYLADGLTESLISRLAHLSEVSVKARSTVFQYKGKDISLSDIGQELGVDAVLTGRLEKDGERLLFKFELVDVRNGDQIWGRNYTRGAADVALLENAVSMDLLEALGPQVTEDERSRVTKQHTSSPEAFNHYLRGRLLWNKRTAEGLKGAIREFTQAVENDPGFALAFAGLADSYVLLENYSGSRSSDSLPRARAYAAKALELDDSLAEAHASMAIVHHRSWNWEEAATEYDIAIRKKPNYASVRHWYSLYLRELGRFEESLAQAKIAKELDPLSGIIIANQAAAYIARDDQDSARSLLERSIEFDPNFPWYHAIIGLADSKDGRHESAVAAAKKGYQLAAGSVNALSIYGFVLAKAGKRAEAEEIVRELESKYTEGTASGRNIARVYAGLGDLDNTFTWLERDLEARSSFLPYIRWMPTFDGIRSDPRYEKLLSGMGIS